MPKYTTMDAIITPKPASKEYLNGIRDTPIKKPMIPGAINATTLRSKARNAFRSNEAFNNPRLTPPTTAIVVPLKNKEKRANSGTSFLDLKRPPYRESHFLLSHPGNNSDLGLPFGYDLVSSCSKILQQALFVEGLHLGC